MCPPGYHHNGIFLSKKKEQLVASSLSLFVYSFLNHLYI